MLDTNMCIYLIGAHAVALGVVLVTNDQADFVGYANLRTEILTVARSGRS